MAGIAAIHHPLSKVNSRPSHVCLVVQISHLIDRPAMNAHAKSNMRIALQRFGNFHCTMHRFFRTLEKNQRHTITGCNTNQFAGCTTLAELRCRSHNLIELLHHFALLVYKQSGVTHYVNKQHVSNFQM